MDPTEGTEGAPENPEIPLPELDNDPSEVTDANPNEATADNDPTDDEDDDPVETAVQARLAQEADKMAEAALARARRETDEQAQTAAQRRAEAEEAERLSNSFATAIRESYEAAKGLQLYDAMGNEIALDDKVFEDIVVKPMQKFNSTAEKAHQTRIFGALAQSAMELLPETEREAFARKAAGKPLPEWLATLADTLAPHSTYARSLAKETETKVKAAEARGFVKGQKAPAGTPRAGGERAGQTNQPDLTTAFGIGDALNKGLIDQTTASTAWRKLNS